MEPGTCGCGTPDVDTDADGTLDCHDGCVDDANKVAAGECGCGEVETPGCSGGSDSGSGSDAGGSSDGSGSDSGSGSGSDSGSGSGDGSGDGVDQCPDDDAKTEPGVCGCGVADEDTDSDGVLDCEDACPQDPGKHADSGTCGCGNSDADEDGDGEPACNDECPEDAVSVVETATVAVVDGGMCVYAVAHGSSVSAPLPPSLHASTRTS